MTALAPKLSLDLERVVCTRCAGSGAFSFNLMHGSRCYGCGGTGKTFTKRGAAAAAFFKQQRLIGSDDVKVGDLIQITRNAMSSATVFARVTEVAEKTLYDLGYRNSDSKEVTGFRIIVQYKSEVIDMVAFHNTTYIKGMTADEKVALASATMTYQATLGKNGKQLKSAKHA